MKVCDFDYFLPPELVAQQPSQKRDHSRLLVLDRKSGAIRHEHFFNLPDLLTPGDLLVLNDTKVLPARLYAEKSSGGRLELLLLNPLAGKTWHCLVKPAKRARVGTLLEFALGLTGEIVAEGEKGLRTIAFSLGGDEFQTVIDMIGEMPLPPYIHEKPADPGRYQTVFAAKPGAVAAPTAGLHFTPELFQKLEASGIDCVYVTLHVGIGTFRPVSAARVEDHKMHSEYYSIHEHAASTINAARAAGRRIVAVGTTAVRVLETATGDDGTLVSGTGWTDIFIYPGYGYRGLDGLITNFHLPRSTLLMLVAAFAGKENTLAAYGEAVAQKYRFFSFGDAMLVE